MNNKILITLMLLITMTGLAFAAPSITINQPTTTSVWQGTQTIDFNVIDENASAHDTAPVINLYYSTTAGGFKNVIVADTNVDNGTGIVCADYNFFETTNCTYSWTIPTNLENGYYYIDANYIPRTGSAGYTDSSERFSISQYLSAGSCGLVALFPLLLVAALIIAIVVGAMMMTGGNITGSLISFTIVGIVVIVILIIMPTFTKIACGA